MSENERICRGQVKIREAVGEKKKIRVDAEKSENEKRCREE
jgi:hypothetical protein